MIYLKSFLLLIKWDKRGNSKIKKKCGFIINKLKYSFDRIKIHSRNNYRQRKHYIRGYTFIYRPFGCYCDFLFCKSFL